MSIRDILNKDTFVYVLDFYKLKEYEVPNKINIIDKLEKIKIINK